MSSKKKKTALTVEQQITYLHRRIARLERNNGQHVHPHPTETSVEDEAAAEAARVNEIAQEARRKAAEKARLAKEVERKAVHAEAESAAPLDPTAPDAGLPEGETAATD